MVMSLSTSSPLMAMASQLTSRRVNVGSSISQVLGSAARITPDYYRRRLIRVADSFGDFA